MLPFGAVKSVHSFWRLARAIWWIGTTACLLVWSSFYDDYILFSTPDLVRSSEIIAAALFELLGWDYRQKMGESAFRSPILARRSESFSTWKNLLKAFASCSTPPPGLRR